MRSEGYSTQFVCACVSECVCYLANSYAVNIQV